MRNFLLIFSLFCLFSCDNATHNSSDFKADVAYTDNANGGQSNNSADGWSLREKDAANNGDTNFGGEVLANRKMIWSANLRMQVDAMDSATQVISKLAVAKGGFVSSLTRTNNNYQKETFLTLRIPNKEFPSFLEAGKGVAAFLESEEISSRDVTAQFVDVESRLASKKEARKRYMEILRNKTGDIEAVIEAEEAIRRITEEIEAKESKMRSLKDQIAMSTVAVTLIEKIDYRETPKTFEKSFGSKAKKALKSGWEGITGFLLGLLYIWPLLIFLLLGFFFFKRWRKRRKMK